MLLHFFARDLGLRSVLTGHVHAPLRILGTTFAAFTGEGLFMTRMFEVGLRALLRNRVADGSFLDRRKAALLIFRRSVSISEGVYRVGHET